MNRPIHSPGARSALLTTVLTVLVGVLTPFMGQEQGRDQDCLAAAEVVETVGGCCSVEVETVSHCCCEADPRVPSEGPVADDDCGCHVEPGSVPSVPLLPPVTVETDLGAMGEVPAPRVSSSALPAWWGRVQRVPEVRNRSGPDLVILHSNLRL